MDKDSCFILERDTVRKPYTLDVAEYCNPFSCSDKDLDEFFAKDALFYDSELLGRTYAWIDLSNPTNILAMITLANDSVKAKLLKRNSLHPQQEIVFNEA